MPPKKKKKRKSAYCGFLLAMLLPVMAVADSVNLGLSYTAAPLGTASQSAAAIYGLDSSVTYTATLRQIGVDAFGNLKGSTTTAQLVSLTSSYVYASATALSVGTVGLAVNVSTVAGATCNDCWSYWSTRDAVGTYWDYGNTSSIPATLGHFTAASVTATKDSGFVNGEHIYFKSPSGTINVFLTVKKRQ